MKWKKSKIGNHCEITSSKRIFYSEYVDSGVPFYRSKEIIEIVQGQQISEPLYISEHKYNEIKKRFGVPVAGDMLLTSVGTIGVPYVIKPDDRFYFKDGNLTWFRNFDDYLLSKFLCYWIGSKEGYSVLNNTTIGSSQKALTITSLNQIECPMPKTDIQLKIVEILSVYDDLIENNQKQIKLLEEAAQRLYKEWFVDLRFPGHEQTRIVDGVPEGWKRKTVKDCLEYHINGGWGKDLPTSNNRFKGEVIRGTDIQDIKGGRFSDIPIRYHSEKDIVKRILKKYDIIFELSNGNINSIGRTLLLNENILNICGENTICASFCKLLRPINYIHSLILYWEIQDMQLSGRLIPFKKQGANGINNFAFEDFLQHSLLITEDKNIIKMFDSFMQKISVLQNQLFLLTEARDRLLPKLMNGEIEL